MSITLTVVKNESKFEIRLGTIQQNMLVVNRLPLKADNKIDAITQAWDLGRDLQNYLSEDVLVCTSIKEED